MKTQGDETEVKTGGGRGGGRGELSEGDGGSMWQSLIPSSAHISLPYRLLVNQLRPFPHSPSFDVISFLKKPPLLISLSSSSSLLLTFIHSSSFSLFHNLIPFFFPTALSATLPLDSSEQGGGGGGGGLPSLHLSSFMNTARCKSFLLCCTIS